MINNFINGMWFGCDLFSLYGEHCVSSQRTAAEETRFVQVLENLESPGILLWHFPGLESPGKRLLVLKRSGNLLNSSKKLY